MSVFSLQMLIFPVFRNLWILFFQSYFFPEGVGEQLWPFHSDEHKTKGLMMIYGQILVLPGDFCPVVIVTVKTEAVVKRGDWICTS